MKQTYTNSSKHESQEANRVYMSKNFDQSELSPQRSTFTSLTSHRMIENNRYSERSGQMHTPVRVTNDSAEEVNLQK